MELLNDIGAIFVTIMLIPPFNIIIAGIFTIVVWRIVHVLRKGFK